MGSAASELISSKIKDQSAENIEQALKELDSDEIHKVFKAADSARKSRPASFHLLQALLVDIEINQDYDKISENGTLSDMQASQKDFANQAFERYDKKKTGKLDSSDAAVFFEDLVRENHVLLFKHVNFQIASYMADYKEAIDKLPNAKEHVPGALEVAQAQVDTTKLDELRADNNKLVEAFAAKKDSLTAAAFAKVCGGEDGISSKEFSRMIAGPDLDSTLELLGIEWPFLPEFVGDCVGPALEAANRYLKKHGIKVEEGDEKEKDDD